MSFAVCTLVRNRHDHLRRMLAALEAQTRQPDVVVVAVMGGEDPQPILDGCDLPIRRVDVADEETPLPLARARNAARGLAGCVELLVFLDVDVVLAPDALEEYRRRCCRDLSERRRRVWSGSVAYLPPGPTPEALGALRAAGTHHPARPQGVEDRPLPRPELFWTLSFALPARLWDELGGIDTAYRGYGAEDTDFALRAAAAGVQLWTTPAVEGFHQHHEGEDPPRQHLADIVANARTFRERWDRWPMEGWLSAFADEGLIRWDPDSDVLELVERTPVPLGT